MQIRDARLVRGGEFLVELVGRGTTTRRWVATNSVDQSVRSQVVEEATKIIEQRTKAEARVQERVQLKNDRRKADRRSYLRRQAERIEKACW